MKKSHDVVPTEQQDSFLRVYPRVLADTDLNPLQKLILSDILSYQLRGQSYFKSSSDVGESLGGYKPKTIQSAFQQLAKLGYINTDIKQGTKKNYTLRYASVVDMEYWVQNEDCLKGRKRKAIAPAPSTQKVDVNLEHSQDELSITEESANQILKASAPANINDRPQEIEGLLFVPIEFITHAGNIRNELLEEEEHGRKLSFIQAAIVSEGEVFEVERVIQVNNDNGVMYMRWHDIYEPIVWRAKAS